MKKTSPKKPEKTLDLIYEKAKALQISINKLVETLTKDYESLKETTLSIPFVFLDGYEKLLIQVSENLASAIELKNRSLNPPPPPPYAFSKTKTTNGFFKCMYDAVIISAQNTLKTRELLINLATKNRCNLIKQANDDLEAIRTKTNNIGEIVMRLNAPYTTKLANVLKEISDAFSDSLTEILNNEPTPEGFLMLDVYNKKATEHTVNAIDKEHQERLANLENNESELSNTLTL